MIFVETEFLGVWMVYFLNFQLFVFFFEKRENLD